MTVTVEMLQVDGLATRQYVLRSDVTRGLPIVLLHGWGASSDLMRPVMERMQASGYSMFAPDLPGFGETDAPPAAWSVFDYARWVNAYFTAAGIDRANLIGHSFGGRLGLILGSDESIRVEKMIVADAAGIPPKRPLSGQVRLALYKALRRLLNGIGANTLAERFADWYRRRYGSSDYQQVTGVMRETFVRVVNQNLKEHAARVRVPTLLVWGDRDEDTPLWQGKTLENIIPDAGLVVFEGAGHYSYLDHLNEFVRIADHFFSS